MTIALRLVDRRGTELAIAGDAGSTAMETIRDAGYDELAAYCGGACSCGTCHVYVDPAFVDRLPGMSADERELLTGSVHRDARLSRLSCQIRLRADLDGMRLTIAPAD